ncbi:uncharacterized protein LOC111921889 [Lactuca sativa]|uniref:uncharacterized protein LOC111921889 n=1 Tax=Lactuca sativa TaxID=4236 RepID=UPI000CD7E704|nr:uncharacterized protein LOC111921889 [Lactuca sativa]
MGELNAHAYCDKVKKLADLLEGIGEKVKHRNLISYALNGLSQKFESVANILHHRKPIPSFSEMRTTLSVEETRLASSAVSSSSYPSHSSSHSLLHVDSGSSNRGKGSNSNRGRNRSHRGGNHASNYRHPPTINPNSFGNHQYGWFFVPPLKISAQP